MVQEGEKVVKWSELEAAVKDQGLAAAEVVYPGDEGPEGCDHPCARISGRIKVLRSVTDEYVIIEVSVDRIAHTATASLDEEVKWRSRRRRRIENRTFFVRRTMEANPVVTEGGRIQIESADIRIYIDLDLKISGSGSSG